MKNIILGLKPTIDDLKNITDVYVREKANHLGIKLDEVKVGRLNPTEFLDISCPIIVGIEDYLNNSPPMSNDEKLKVKRIAVHIKEALCHGPAGRDENPFATARTKSHGTTGRDEKP